MMSKLIQFPKENVRSSLLNIYKIFELFDKIFIFFQYQYHHQNSATFDQYMKRLQKGNFSNLNKILM